MAFAGSRRVMAPTSVIDRNRRRNLERALGTLAARRKLDYLGLLRSARQPSTSRIDLETREHESFSLFAQPARYGAPQPKPTNTVPGITYMLPVPLSAAIQIPMDTTSMPIEVGPH